MSTNIPEITSVKESFTTKIKQHIKFLQLNQFGKWLWWRFMPGTVIKVQWPVGKVVVLSDPGGWDWIVGSSPRETFSADPNDYYRPWLEANVGQQGWDWDWRLTDNDIAENQLTIKFRKSRTSWASIAALRWE